MPEAPTQESIRWIQDVIGSCPPIPPDGSIMPLLDGGEVARVARTALWWDPATIPEDLMDRAAAAYATYTDAMGDRADMVIEAHCAALSSAIKMRGGDDHTIMMRADQCHGLPVASCCLAAWYRPIVKADGSPNFHPDVLSKMRS